ncbi:type III polyketide synthase [Cohnella thermotolerans]|uniref:type III polyketide synthase n=1 Tax=Cohnella thermotolerans TaxID=329858 RepID=UPI0003FA4168
MEMNHSNPVLRGIGTAVPPNVLPQEDVTARLAEALAGAGDAPRWARRIFRQSGVDRRYTCEPNLLETAGLCRYAASADPGEVPTTAERMRLYERESVPLARQAAERALLDGETSPGDVTHLITVSCTGQFLPGLDVALAKGLALRPDVRRIPLTFLGCAAGLTAIRLARDIAKGEPAAVVLVVCVELCTLHIQPSADRQALYATAFFGDGASACVIAGGGKGVFALGDGRTLLFPDSADEMVWKLGPTGFDLYLSPRIPSLIGRAVPPELQDWLGGGEPPRLWAIHPGGRGIVDALQSALALTDEQTRASRAVLREYGNLSSATLLFVLQDMRRELEARDLSSAQPETGVAIAFGPGVGAEMMKIAYLPAAPAEREELALGGAAHA